MEVLCVYKLRKRQMSRMCDIDNLLFRNESKTNSNRKAGEEIEGRCYSLLKSP